MKLLAGLVWASAALQSYAASSEALVFTFDGDGNHLQAESPSLSPCTARLLLAQRLGLSQFHSLRDADESILYLLNSLRGTQETILPADEQRSVPGKLLIIIEGVEHPDEIIDPQTTTPAFTIYNPPSSSQNSQLVLDLLSQDRYRRVHKESGICSIDVTASSAIRGGCSGNGNKGDRTCNFDDFFHINEDRSPLSQLQTLQSLSSGNPLGIQTDERTTILQISSLKEITSSAGSPHKEEQLYTQAIESLKLTIANLKKSNNPLEATIILMPPTTKQSKHSDYGSYETPSNSLNPRRFAPEEPLSMPPDPSTSTLSSQEDSQPNSAFRPLNKSSSKLPKRGILPVCHPTLNATIAATNNCSGHGTVYKKYQSALDKRDGIPCFACRCHKTVLTSGKGHKTIFWGGPACQKKDISMPFFLLAGLSIALLATVSWGIGLLFSIGQEDLPSVIGAGVAGPRVGK